MKEQKQFHITPENMKNSNIINNIIDKEANDELDAIFLKGSGLFMILSCFFKIENNRGIFIPCFSLAGIYGSEYNNSSILLDDASGNASFRIAINPAHAAAEIDVPLN